MDNREANDMKNSFANSSNYNNNYSSNGTNANSNRSMSTTIDAAALQADMARRFNLPGGITRSKTKRITNTANSRGTNTSKSTSSSRSFQFHSQNQNQRLIYCQSCHHSNSESSRLCSSCGYYLTSAVYYSEPTLSEIRGLKQAEPKAEVILQSQWDEIENNLVGISFI